MKDSSDCVNTFGGSDLENDPLYAIQGHVVYTITPGLWVSSGVAFGSGAESKIDGERKDDQKENIVWGLSLGVPLRKDLSLKFAYVVSDARSRTGTDSNSFIISLAHYF